MRLGPDEVLELGTLYRSTTSDLAAAQRDFPRDAVAERLNDLVAATHALVYSEAPTSGRRLRRFIARELPASVRAAGPFTLVAALLLFGPALATYGLGLLFPDIATSTMSEATRDHLVHRQPGAEIAEADRVVVGPLIIANNIYVSMLAFAGGMTLGALTGFVLVNNGASLGTTFAVLQRHGGADSLATFIVAHGFLELSAIVLSGGAGLRLAWAILRPGEFSRIDALRLAGAQAFRVVLLVIATLAVAGVIEAFISPSLLLPRVKLAVGLVTGALLWLYIGGGIRRPRRAARETDPV